VSYRDINYWQTWTGYDAADTFLCEKIYQNNIIKQPMNTISNILYLFFGLQIFQYCLYDYKNYNAKKNNLLKANFQYSALYCFAFLVLFLVSSVFHASMLQLFLRFDMIGVYLSLLLPFFYTLHKFINLKLYQNNNEYSPLISISILVSMLVSTAICSVYFWNYESYFIGSFILIITFFINYYFTKKFVASHHIHIFRIALFLGIVSLNCYQFDYLFCNRSSYLQLHALWHCTSAISMYLFYLYMRTEQLAA
jgi:hypothetical protein